MHLYLCGFSFRWRSYQDMKSTMLAHNIHDIIMKLFERIESQHGKILVATALGYVTASKGGVSEAELEDLLSLDDKVWGRRVEVK